MLFPTNVWKPLRKIKVLQPASLFPVITNFVVFKNVTLWWSQLVFTASHDYSVAFLLYHTGTAAAAGPSAEIHLMLGLADEFRL